MNTAPRFAVIVHRPNYDDRDCIASWTLCTVDRTMTKAWAFAVAVRYSYDGEYPYEVRDIATGDRVHLNERPADPSIWDTHLSDDPFGDGVPF
jgi:hypothetical protein